MLLWLDFLLPTAFTIFHSDATDSVMAIPVSNHGDAANCSYDLLLLLSLLVPDGFTSTVRWSRKQELQAEQLARPLGCCPSWLRCRRAEYHHLQRRDLSSAGLPFLLSVQYVQWMLKSMSYRPPSIKSGFCFLDACCLGDYR